MRENFVDSNHWCWGDYKCDPVLNEKKYGYDGGDCSNSQGLLIYKVCFYPVSMHLFYYPPRRSD